MKDVRPYLQRSAVFVAPMLDGVGLRGKILEAWAMEKPVVATSLAMLGLDHPDGYAGFIADDQERFADRVCTLLENEMLADEMGKRARELVMKSYSWDAFSNFYDAAYTEAMQKMAGSAATASPEKRMHLKLQQTSGVGK